jgi:hypothetical protein
MAGKLKVQPVSRVGLEPLVSMAEQLRAGLAGWEDTAPVATRPRIPTDLALDLGHLARHDLDGLISVSLGEEVVGFAAAYVRSRHLTVTPLWLLPEHQSGRIADVLLRRLLTFGDRAGVTDASAHVVGSASFHALGFRFGLRPRFPVYRLRLSSEDARHAGQELAKALPGHEVTHEAAYRRTGVGDLERLDRLVRGVARPMDHEYWLSERNLRLVTVREGQRVAAYSYGGAGQCGPVVATTNDAALAALGWALQFAADVETVNLYVPALFETAVEHILEAGGECVAVSHWFSSQPGGGMERYVLAGPTLA